MGTQVGTVAAESHAGLGKPGHFRTEIERLNQNTNTPMKTTVIHHSADFDGIFCREIARKFLPDAEIIGWDFGDKPLAIPDGQIYILDLPVDRVFGYDFKNMGASELLDETLSISQPGSQIGGCAVEI